MRTTIDIPYKLGKQVRVRAAQLGQPIKRQVTRALEREIAGDLSDGSTHTRRVLTVIRSHAPGSMTLFPEEIGAPLVREESAAYGSERNPAAPLP